MKTYSSLPDDTTTFQGCLIGSRPLIKMAKSPLVKGKTIATVTGVKNAARLLASATDVWALWCGNTLMLDRGYLLEQRIAPTYENILAQLTTPNEMDALFGDAR